MWLAGAVHVGLVFGHGDEQLLAVSFLVGGAGLLTSAAALLVTQRVRLVSSLLLGGVLAAYVATHITGSEGVDILGAVTVVIEATALVLIVRPAGRLASRDTA
jgi:hypothetical protein